MERDHIELLQELTDKGVVYLMIGGQAVNAHGIPRYTRDMDIYIRSSVENSQAVYAALAAFGAPLMGTTASELADGRTVLQIGVEPTRVDVVQLISGMDFETAWENRVYITLKDGTTAPVISIPDLIRNKQASGRPQDLADVALLNKFLARKSRPNRP